MRTSRLLAHGLVTLGALLVLSMVALAADPGLVYPAASEVSDQKAGSILIFNTYTSSASAPAQENTRINITNTSTTSAAFVHLFFVEGQTCGVADTFICFTANQTASFTTSDADPGTRGYIVAIAVDGVFGCPFSNNVLIGDEYVKYASGHAANLGAEAIAALFQGPLPGCDANSVAAAINFNGVAGAGYNLIPRVLADDSIPSRLDGNDTKLIVNRIGGNLATGAATLSTLFVVIYDDAENTFSTTITGQCHLELSLGANNLPRVVGGWNALIPAGHTGWLKFWSTADIGILGAAINFNAGTAGFNGGHNLHKLTLSATNNYVMPVFPPAC